MEANRLDQRAGSPPHGQLIIASCRSGVAFAERVVDQLCVRAGEEETTHDVVHLAGVDFQFSDGESCVRLEEDVNGADLFLVQALFDPVSRRSVDENYVAFLAAIRTLREWGAARVTGVLPYLAYARQDKPTRFQREPTTAQLMADLSREAGLDRLLVWAPHSAQVHGFYGKLPVHALSALPLFADEFRALRGRPDVVVVAPDGGASKLIMHVARQLEVSAAVASKFRPQSEEAELVEMMGDFAGKRIAVVLDDMINTGGTIQASIRCLAQEKGIDQIYLGVFHNLCTPRARQRLVDLHASCGLRTVVVTDSIPQTEAFQELPFLRVRPLTLPIARAISRIHHNRQVDVLELLAPSLAEKG